MTRTVLPLTELVTDIVDNRGRTCPTSASGIRLIATNCIKEDGLYPIYEKVRYVTEETYKTWFRGHPEPGDIILVTKGAAGAVCLVPDQVDFCIAQDMVSLRADSSKIYPKYLFAVLRSPQVREAVAGMHVGTMIPHFKKGDFKNLIITVPDVSMQKFIGDLYYRISEKIELNRKMNETLEQMGQALFRHYFIDNPDAEQWEEGVLGDIITNFDSKRKPLSSRQRSEMKGQYRYFGATSVMDYVNDFLFDGTYLLLAEDGSVIKDDGTPYLQYIWGKFWVNNHAHVLQAKAPFTVEYLYLLLVRANVQSLVNGAVQLKINQKAMNGYKIKLPPNELVISFCEKIEPIFTQRRQNEDQIQTLTTLRDTLLPRLISGKVNV